MGCLCFQAKLSKYTLLTDQLITGIPLWFEPAQEKWFKSNHPYIYNPLWLSWMVIFEALVGCHDILTLGKSPIKWRQCPDMTFAFDWDVKHEVKQKLPLSCLPSVFVDAYIW